MKNLIKSITNSSTMLNGYSYDRTEFQAHHVWTRSLLSAAISTGLTCIGVYCGYLAMDAQFATALGSQAVNFKLATGAVIASLLGYSLRDLFRSITSDVKTQLRVARANSWLVKGNASTHDYSAHIAMQQTQLSMVRYVEVEGGIKVFAIAKHQDHPNPILIDTMLFDEEYPAMASFYTHAADIRSTLNEACAEWSGSVAEQLGIALTPQQAGAPSTVLRQKIDDEAEFELDDAMFDDLENDTHPVFARANAPRRSPGEALRRVSQIPPEAITH
ncbi:hypothetical protein [Pseudomonas sp. MWU12-2323]|uniref:hypothetical protein n=1 Tax=Pseudomonas sp. MWU12-2323 TaxID=2651296 RepID=UPI00128D89CB|nr:hypothetical protein [Pseudomonas sp. MWU12-2323]MPQ71462.1 hypothetical protein [Pseudomonas sp. MWU12-2323]